jgi:predicted ribosome quality control (RQC) complex YloA/Tae2 family protein
VVKRFGFDALCLAAAVQEAQALVGGRIQRVVQPSSASLHLEVYARGDFGLLISVDPSFARLHLSARRLRQSGEPTAALTLMRRYLKESRIAFIRQRGLDRIVDIGVSGSQGEVQLVAEIMGKHSNAILVGPDRAVIEGLKRVGLSRSRRPILPGRAYEPPPFPPRPPISQAGPEDDLREFDGWSPTLQDLLDSGAFGMEDVRAALAGAWRPHRSRELGIYPLPFPGGEPVDKFGEECDLWTLAREALSGREERRRRLIGQLTPALKARTRALDQLAQALQAAEKAAETQQTAELLLAYQGAIPAGASLAQVWDYEGREIEIALDPELTAVENAERLFRRARRAKDGADEAESQRARIAEEAAALRSAIAELPEADEKALDRLEEEAARRRWLREASIPVEKAERPFEGHPIRELLSPGGWKVLYGVNSTANDYLTTKVARPNDWWLHVRGQASSHVVLQTGNQPLRVPYPDLVFAAEVAVRHSAAKHASYVPVDYTLKKHVRKPRKSAPGFASYVQEKTIFIDKPV